VAKKRPTDPSVRAEPHLRGMPLQLDPSERRADRTLAASESKGEDEDQRVEHTVWDEPARSDALSGPVPEDAVTYARWLRKKRSQVLPATSWAVTFFIAEIAGLWAVIGAFMGSGQTVFNVVAATVFAPVVEEIMKVSAALYVVERRPYLFRSGVQIALCAVMGGLLFGVLENVLYMNVYVPNPARGLATWRWTVCTALHVTCSFIMGLGLIRVWAAAERHCTRPQLSLAYPFTVAAIVLHAGYNTAAALLHALHYTF